jgi:hypothetical protein
MIDTDGIRAGLGFFGIFYGLTFGCYGLMCLLSRARAWLMGQPKGDTVQIVEVKKDGNAGRRDHEGS